MSRTLSRTIVWFAVLLLVLGSQVVRAEGVGEKVFPASTKGFFSATNYEDLKAHWGKTQIGRLMADPVMQPFVKDFRRQMLERYFDLQKKLGLTVEDLQDVPTGELSLGVIQSPQDTRALVILMDVTGRLDKAQAMLDKATRNLTASGAKLSEAVWSGTPVRVLDMPAEEKQLPQQTIYFLKDNWLGAADNQAVMQDVLARLAGQKQGGLVDVEAYQAVIARAQSDAGADHVPQFRWFVEPIAYMELRQKAQPPKEPRRSKSRLEKAKDLGFEAIRGVGGFVDLDSEGFQILHRTAIDAPNTPEHPWEKSMKMLVFLNDTEFAPQDWVPREIAVYATAWGDLTNAFDNFAPMADAIFGEGETGIWPDLLDSLELDPNGPQINLKQELVANLADRGSMISDYEMPITTTSERQLFAIQVKDEAKVIAAVEKLFKNEKPEDARRREVQGRVIWERPPRKAVAAPKVSLGAPSLDRGRQTRRRQQEQERFFPNASITVAHGHLMVASHYDFLIKVLEEAEKGELLSDDVEYRVVDATLKKIGANEDCFRLFSRTDEELRVTYELFRQGKMPEAKTMLARLLSAMRGSDGSGKPQKQQLDGSKLPDYDYVRRALGPAGAFARTEETGWFLKGFLMNRP